MIRIVVDSAADYPLAEIKEKKMDLVPITITIGEKSYIDGIDLKRDEIYQIMEETGEFAKTAQPSPQAFLDVFEDAKKKGDEVICILLSSALSGTYQSAVMAKQMCKYEKIDLVDSLSATYVIKVLADYAWRLREEGMEAREITEKVEALKSRVKVVAALDTLEYLSRGGRISKAAAAIGDMANIKPIIAVTKEGTVGILGKCIGKNKAFCQLVKQLRECEPDENFPMYTLYSYGMENCGKLEEKMSKEGFSAEKRLQIGATIGAHVGPEAFGIVFVSKK